MTSQWNICRLLPPPPIFTSLLLQSAWPEFIYSKFPTSHAITCQLLLIVPPGYSSSSLSLIWTPLSLLSCQLLLGSLQASLTPSNTHCSPCFSPPPESFRGLFIALDKQVEALLHSHCPFPQYPSPRDPLSLPALHLFASCFCCTPSAPGPFSGLPSS